MSRPLSAKREQQIRGLPELLRRHAWTAAEDAADAIRELLAEIDRLRAERPEGTEPDLSGWSAEENARFEELYGVQAAMRLRASNNRVWQIVHELRSKAADAGLDPYQDPMAQRLAAALVQPDPEAAPKSDAGQGAKRSARTMTLVAVFLRVTGLTHAETGRLLGVSGNAVAAWERGARMNQAHRDRLEDLNCRAQIVPSKAFYGRREAIFAPRDGKPSIYDEWLAEGWTPPIDADGEAAYFETGEPEYRFVQPDGSVSEFDVHNGPCGCQRQSRHGDGPWLAAGGWASAETAQALEPGPAPFTLPSREALEVGIQSHLRALDSRTTDNNSPNTIPETNTEEPTP